MIRRKHTDVSERRLDIRHEGGTLRCRIEDEEVDVLDVSIGGIRLGRPRRPVRIGEKIQFAMVVEDGISAVGIVRVLTPSWMALEFLRPNFPLLKQICRHVADLHALTSTMGLGRLRAQRRSPGE